MNLKYCHFTFPPSSPSLLLSDFPLSYLSSRHHHHHLLHKRSLSLSLSLKHASSPLHRHLFLVPFLFIKSPIFAPTDQTRCIPFSPISLSFSPIISPSPPSKRFPNVFLARFRRLVQVRRHLPPRCTPSCRLPSCSPPSTIDAPGRICKFRLNGIGGDDKSNGNRKSQ